MRRGFTLVELLVAIAIIGILASLVAIAAAPALRKSRDAKRQQAVALLGRFLAGGNCFVPAAGSGDYDLGELAAEIQGRYPQAASLSWPHDPRGGTDQATGYRYAVSADASLCAVYANLEDTRAAVTIKDAAGPGLAHGSGVVRGTADGRNGTDLFFQVSN